MRKELELELDEIPFLLDTNLNIILPMGLSVRLTYVVARYVVVTCHKKVST